MYSSKDKESKGISQIIYKKLIDIISPRTIPVIMVENRKDTQLSEERNQEDTQGTEINIKITHKQITTRKYEEVKEVVIELIREIEEYQN